MLWVLWAFVSILVLIEAGSNDGLLIAYFSYLAVSTFALWRSRHDLLAPVGAFTLVAFSGFGFNIPLIAAGYVPYIQIDNATLTKVLAIVLSAQLGFTCGVMITRHVQSPLRRLLNTSLQMKRTSIFSFAGLIVLQVAAGATRKWLHLGEAGSQPSVGYAGVLQFFLYHGVLILCVWYLAQALADKKRMHAVMGLLLLLGMAITQALMGWRGWILYVIIIAIVPFWYQFISMETRRHFSMGWLIILLFSSSSVIHLGGMVRTERLGGESGFTKGTEELLRNVFLRSQGTTRLAEVAHYFGPLSFTNNFLIQELMAKNSSVTVYIDRNVYGIEPTQSHSVGSSGPGGPYTAAGILGVLITYGFIGFLYRESYHAIFRPNTSKISVLAVVWYAFLILMLFEILNENFGINSLKMYFAVLAQLCLFKLFLTRNQKA